MNNHNLREIKEKDKEIINILNSQDIQLNEFG